MNSQRILFSRGCRKGTGVLIACLIIAAVTGGCEAQTRYKVLSFFFDGVPNPAEETASKALTGSAQAPSAPKGTIAYYEHGPYAAKLCDGCHERSTNTLVAPPNELCFKCHEFPTDKKLVHGPLTSGDCRVCHEPHSSRYQFLLVSEPQSFCLYCHDEKTIERNAAHAGDYRQCTSCHDAHMSDRKYLLK